MLGRVQNVYRKDFDKIFIRSFAEFTGVFFSDFFLRVVPIYLNGILNYKYISVKYNWKVFMSLYTPRG